MKNFIQLMLRVVLGVSLVFSALGMVTAPAQDRGASPRALVISLDGMDFRYLQEADQLGLKIPVLRELMANGISAGVYGTFPSLTYPAHTTIATGVEPDRHRIYGNELIEPLERKSGNLNAFADAIRADTLWDAARRGGLRVGMVSWPVGGGAGDFNAPEILHNGNKPEQNLALIKANARPLGLIDEIAAHDPGLFANVTKDEQDDMRTGFAEYIIEHKKPELMFVHLFDFDHFEHEKGPFVAASMAILEKLDADVGRLLAALDRAGTRAQTTVFVVSDHGFLPTKWQINPGVALVNAGLITIREEPEANGKTKAVVTDWKIMPYITGASCALILKDPNDKETALKAWIAMSELAAEDNDGKTKDSSDRMTLLSPAQIRARHSNPLAALMLEAHPDYLFGSNLDGPATVASKQLGQHGYFPERYQASFIAAGPAVTGRGRRAQVRMTQIAPTVAKVLGIHLRDARMPPISLR